MDKEIKLIVENIIVIKTDTEKEYTIEDMRKAYEVGRTDSRMSDREGRYVDCFDEFFN